MCFPKTIITTAINTCPIVTINTCTSSLASKLNVRKSLLVTLVAFLALLAVSHAQSDEDGNTTLSTFDFDEATSSPVPPQPPKSHPAVPRPRPGYPGFPFGGLFRFGLGLRHPGQKPGQQKQPEDANDDNNGNPPRLFPPRILVFYDENTNSIDHNKNFSNFTFGTGNFFGNNYRSKTTTTAAEDYLSED